MPAELGHVIVIGAGITGLQTALTLARAGYTVSIVAEWGPGDEGAIRKKKAEGEYASLWAGAHWRTHASGLEPETCGWDLETYRYWMGMSEEERQAAGLGVYPSFQYWDSPPIPSSLWWTSNVSASASSPPSIQDSPQTSMSFTTVTLNPTLYLSSLLTSLSSLGPHHHTFRARLPTKTGLATTLAAAREVAGLSHEQVIAYVNATGLGARDIVGDENVSPVRGQIVIVRGEGKAVRTHFPKEGGIKYVIPRPRGSDTSVLGGTNEEGEWNTQPSQETTQKILQGAKSLAPELLSNEGEFSVLDTVVGLRPGRKGGPRVELEILENNAEVIIHAYGHGGAGYQNSIGSAQKVLRLLSENNKGKRHEDAGAGERARTTKL